MQRTIVIRRDYLHYIRKYNRFEKRHKNISVHLSPCFRYYTSHSCNHATVRNCLGFQTWIVCKNVQNGIFARKVYHDLLQVMFFLTMVFQAQEALTTLPLANTDAAWLYISLTKY